MIIDSSKYNLVRAALADRQTAKEDIDFIDIRPKRLALKKKHDQDVLDAAWELLTDKDIATGTTPLKTIQSLMSTNQEERSLGPEISLYVMVCYAVALQQGWIRYSYLTNTFIVNTENQDARQYVEDIHNVKLT